MIAERKRFQKVPSNYALEKTELRRQLVRGMKKCMMYLSCMGGSSEYLCLVFLNKVYFEAGAN